MMNRGMGMSVGRCRKRQQANGEDIETVEEIFAKLFVGKVLPQIAVGGGDLWKSIDGMGCNRIRTTPNRIGVAGRLPRGLELQAPCFALAVE